ncbi:type I restriction endonuclease [Nitratidesulfovibrio termitidis]|uniref:type I restriction endonuclease n=1 Tax=Nitratidesulfovibrio termitidis TaxID=42252 RepID=UPI00041836BF|nr:type I restriction endonuclease [Nitratidesulfovibrio termitidis]
MDFSESIKALSDRAQKVKCNLATEEATKTSLVMPFIRALGYDVFNPLEVVPEFIADIAGKKGEKVDYAIMHDGKPIMLIECKCCGANMNDANRDQLHRYFLTLDSYIGILTDGIRYRFFSAADDGKNMDATPFMEFDLENPDPTLLPELRKLCKGKFDLQNTLDAVSQLKFNRQVKMVLAQNLEDPDEEFVKFFIRTAGKVAYKNTILQHAAWVKRAMEEFIAEQIDARLKTALAATPKKEELAQDVECPSDVPSVVTTEEEWQAFYLVKSILMGVVPPESVFIRDGVNFCNILFEDTLRQPLLRLFFNNPEKLAVELVVGMTGEKKEFSKHQITGIDDILQYSDAIRETVRMYLAKKGQKER